MLLHRPPHCYARLLPDERNTVPRKLKIRVNLAPLVRWLKRRGKRRPDDCMIFPLSLYYNLGHQLVSESPFDRWFGSEILTCTDAACRLPAELPAIYKGHTCGVFTDLRFSPSKLFSPRAIWGRLVFSKSAQWQALRKDILSGAPHRASIGYDIVKAVEESDGVFRVTDWNPLYVTIEPLSSGNSRRSGRRVTECGDK